MKLKITLYSVAVFSILSLIGWLFWEQEFKYTQPTPVPANLVMLDTGDSVDIPLIGNYQGSLYVHFYNYDCPCSRFNIKEFQSMVRRYTPDVRFLAVLQTDDKHKDRVEDFKNKYDLGIEVISDPEGLIAKSLGVYSTPQAVIIENGKLFYKGNYNKARFCLSKNTKFAEMAISALVKGNPPPEFPLIAEIAYGCELPSNSNNTNSFFNLF